MTHSLRCPDVWGLFISPEVIAWFFAPGNGDKEHEHLSCVFCGTKKSCVSWFMEDFTNPPVVCQYGWFSNLAISLLIFFSGKLDTDKLWFILLPPSHFYQCPQISNIKKLQVCSFKNRTNYVNYSKILLQFPSIDYLISNLFLLQIGKNFSLALTFKIPRVGENFSNSSITSLYPLLAAFSKAVVPSFTDREKQKLIINICVCWLRTKY